MNFGRRPVRGEVVERLLEHVDLHAVASISIWTSSAS
jgi:hypothetical protein